MKRFAPRRCSSSANFAGLTNLLPQTPKLLRQRSNKSRTLQKICSNHLSPTRRRKTAKRNKQKRERGIYADSARHKISNPAKIKSCKAHNYSFFTYQTVRDAKRRLSWEFY